MNEYQHLWDRIDASGDCWIWTAHIDRDGYGIVGTRKDIHKKAHRAVWEALVGPIPDGFHIDHLCLVRSCVNPDHLEPVTPAENVRRSVTLHGRETHCPYGHPYSGKNLYISVSDKGKKRTCRRCNLLAVRRYSQRKVVG